MTAATQAIQPDDLREMRTVVANVNLALDWLEIRQERYFANPAPAQKAWMTRAERNLQEVLLQTQFDMQRRPDLWPEPEKPQGSLEDASASLTALLDMFAEVDPEIVTDGDTPLVIEETEDLLRSEARWFAAAVANWR